MKMFLVKAKKPQGKRVKKSFLIYTYFLSLKTVEFTYKTYIQTIGFFIHALKLNCLFACNDSQSFGANVVFAI